MFKRGKPAPAAKQGTTREAFEKLLDEELQKDPTAPVDTIVGNAKIRLAAGTEATGSTDQPPTPPHPNFISNIPKPLLWALLVFLLVAIAAVLAIWKPWAPDADPEQTSTPTQTTTAPLAATEIRFDSLAPVAVSPGQSVTLPFTVLAGAEPAAGVMWTAAIEPAGAGTLDPENPLTDRDGKAAVTFTAGTTPQSVTISVQIAGDSPVTGRHVLQIAAPSSLALGFKDAAPEEPIPVGQPFEVVFQVDNQGEGQANAVHLVVDTPAGLDLVEVDGQCERVANGFTCDFTNIPVGQSSTAISQYSAATAGSFAFAPENYRATVGGAAEVPGAESWGVNVEAPRAAQVSIVPALAELPADGVTTTTLEVAVVDQWLKPFSAETMVQVSIQRPAAGADANSPLPTPPVQPAMISCEAMAEITLADPPVAEGDEQPTPLPVGTPLQALAYDADGNRLFVEAASNAAQRGWVARLNASGVEQVSCGDSNFEDLPDMPPITTPADGLIVGGNSFRTTDTGNGTLTYQAGTQKGNVQISAQLVDGQENAIGAPDVAALNLLEVGYITPSTSHIFLNTDDLSGNRTELIVLTRMPGGTPLELFPLTPDTPNARRVALRVWVPNTIVNTNEEGHTTLADQIPSSIRASLSPEPPNLANTDVSQTFSNGAFAQPVKVLEQRGALMLIRIAGWVPMDNITLDQ